MNKYGFLNLLLAGALAFVLLLIAALHTDTTTKNNYLLRGMDTTPAYQDFSVNPVFANGQTLQKPVEGTVSRLANPLHYGTGTAEAERAGRELKNPLNTNDPTVITRGQEIFRRDCLACHGPLAQGNGSATTRGFPPPPTLLNDRVRGFKDGYIFHVITYGGALMPTYAAQIDVMDRWKVIAYLRDLQRTHTDKEPVGPAVVIPTPGMDGTVAPTFVVPTAVPTIEPTAGPTEVPTVEPTVAPTAAAEVKATAVPAPVAKATQGGNWASAEALMKKTDCLTCHSVKAKVVGPAFKDVAKKYAGKDVVPTLVAKVKTGGAGVWGQIPMAGHPQLSDADIETMVRGVLSLKARP